MDTINFMYFLANFSEKQLDGALDVTSAPNHLKNKFLNMKGSNGTEKLFNLFFELSLDNQKNFVNWIKENYNG